MATKKTKFGVTPRKLPPVSEETEKEKAENISASSRKPSEAATTQAQKAHFATPRKIPGSVKSAPKLPQPPPKSPRIVTRSPQLPARSPRASSPRYSPRRLPPEEKEYLSPRNIRLSPRQLLSEQEAEEEKEKLAKAYKDITEACPRYPATKRPIMSRTMHKGEKIKEGKYFLPVTRFGSLCYKEQKDNTFCGKFFFYEPESLFLLELGNYRIFGSKYHAFISLLDEIGDFEQAGAIYNANEGYPATDQTRWVEEDLRKIGYAPGIVQLTRKLQKEKNYSRQETFEKVILPFYTTVLANDTEVKEIPDLGTTPLYPNDSSPIWNEQNMRNGEYDDYDQIICKLARHLKIDTLIFQHEMGQYRSATELCMTRTDWADFLFKVSETEKAKMPEFPVSKKYPITWFLDDGILQAKSHGFAIVPVNYKKKPIPNIRPKFA